MALHPKAKKRILVLAIASGLLVAVAGGLFVYRKLSIRAQYAALRVEGLAAASSGDHVQAVEKLGRYLLRSPDDVAVLVAFARSREQVPLPGGVHLRLARDVYQRAVGLDGGLVDERARLARLLADFGQLPEALDQAERVLAVRPDDATAAAVRAVVLHRLRRFADAQTAALRWTELAPEDVRSLSLVLVAAKEKGDTVETLHELARELEKRATDDKGVAVVRGTLAVLLGDGENGRRWWLEAARANPSSPEEATFIAEQLQNVRLAVESAEYLVRAAERGLLRGGKLLPARRLLELERYDLLDRLLEEVRADDPGQSAEMLAMRAVSLAAGRGDRTAAAPYIEALERRDSPGAKAWRLVVNLLLGGSSENVEEIRRTLETALREGEGAPMLTLVLADAMGRQGEPERAVRMLESLAESSAGWARPMERKAHYEAALGQFDLAFRSAVEAARRAPRDPITLTTLAGVWTSGVEAGVLQNRAELVQFLRELAQAMPSDVTTVPVRVLTLARAGQAAEARAAVEQLVSAARARPSAAMSELLVRTATTSAAVGLGEERRLLELADELGGVTPMSALTRAIIDFSTRGADAVVSRFEASRRTDGPDAKGWAVAWATLLEAVGDARAASAWRAASDAYPQDVSVQRDVLGSGTARRDLGLRTTALQRLRALAGESLTVRLAEAQLALDSPETTPQRLAEVVDRLTEVVRGTPGNAAARILLAQAQTRLGNTAQAIEQLRAVPPSATEAIAAQLMLAELLQRTGDFSGAERVLQETLATGRLGEGQLRGVAVLLAEQGDARRALELLGRRGEDRPDFMKVQLLRQANDLAAAEEEARRLVATQPTVVSVRTLAEIQRARGNVAGATATLARLDELGLPPGVKELALVDYHMRFLELPLARRQAQLATEAAPSNPVAWQALVTVQAAMGDVGGALETVERAADRLPDVEMFAAQRRLAERIRAASADAVLLPVVLALLQNPGDAALVEAISTPTTGAISEGGPSAALSRLRQLAARHPQSLPVQMLVVRRLLQLSQPDEAGQVASKAAESFPTSSEAPALGATAFANRGNWTQALAMARVWRERSGANPLPADLAVSEALVKIGRLQEAAAVVEPYVRGFTEDPAAYLPALFRRAEIASLLNQDDEALRVLAPVLSGRPATWNAWLDYVALRLTPQHALRWAARAEASAEGRDPIVVWQAALVRANALTASGSPDAAQARNRLVELARAEGRGGEYLASAALVLDLAGELEAAERLYRQAMEAGIRGVAVRNNLAMVLVRKGGDLTEAKQLAEGVVAEAGGIAAFVDTLASVLAASGDYPRAEQALVRAVNLEPSNIEWWVHLAEVQVKAGRIEEARATVSAVALVREDDLSPSLRQRLTAVRTAVSN